MNYVYLRVFIENYSLPTLVISAIVAIMNLLYDKFFAEKLPSKVRNLIPFLLSILLYFAYDMIFVLHNFTFSPGTFSAGILSGSLSIVLTTSVYKLKSGKPISINAETMLIEHILSSFVSAELISNTATEIKAILDENNQDLEEQIIQCITKNCQSEINSIELKAMATLMIKAVKAIKQK